MKRQPLIVVVIALQSLLGSALLAIAAYLLVQSLSRDILESSNPAAAARALQVAAAVVGGPALVTLISALGLWKARYWGWLLALASDAGLLGLLIFNFVSEGERDAEEAALALAIAAILGLLILPGVRRYYCQRESSIAKVSSRL